MGEQFISDPQVRINNETFKVVPGTVKMIRGKGVTAIFPQSAGNGDVEHVFSSDVTTKVGKITFSVYVTEANIESIPTLKDNKNDNFVSLSDKEGFTAVMNNAALVNDPEHNFSNDGQVELEFHGETVA